MFVYHDHVITGAPGHGNDGTAGEFKGPWKVIVLVYNPVVALNPMFTPVKSAGGGRRRGGSRDVPAALRRSQPLRARDRERADLPDSLLERVKVETRNGGDGGPGGGATGLGGFLASGAA